MNLLAVRDAFGQGSNEAERLCWADMPGQEDVRCWRNDDHVGPHEALTAPVCIGCGQLEIHRDDCPISDTTTRVVCVVVWYGPRTGKWVEPIPDSSGKVA